MLVPDKIFPTENSTAFVHIRGYNQHKLKFLGGALNIAET